MRRLSSSTKTRQRGMATLAITVLILFLVTLVTLYTANTSITEQRIAANQHRADQALSAANAAMDFAVAYYDRGGIDQNGDDAADFTPAAPYAITLAAPGGSLTTRAEMYFCDASDPALLDPYNADCDPGAFPVDDVVILARGFSDDRSAQHIVTQAVGDIALLGEGGPDRPLITHGGVGLTGNVTVINRYSNATVWSGNAVAIGMSTSASTYLLDPSLDRDSLTRAQLVDADETHNAILASGRERGNNADIIENEPNLASLSDDEFFRNFFIEDKATVARYADDIDQRYDAGSVPSLDQKTRLIWIDGDLDLNGGTIGTQQAPVVLIVDGELRTGGNPNIFGVLYVTGNWTVGGTVNIQGSAIVEGTMVDGNGSLNLVYDGDLFDGDSGNPPGGATGVVAGSWKDW